MENLHLTQKRILKLSQNQNLDALSLRQIGELINISHPQEVKYHLQQLKKKGLISFHSGNSKNLSKKSFLTESVKMIQIPLLGSANAGNATILAQEDKETFLTLNKSILPKTKSIFALKVMGNSMDKVKVKGNYIENGDYIIVDADYNMPEDNEIVVSIINGYANVKKFQIDRENQRILLTSQSSEQENHPPIIIQGSDIEDYLVNGKVIQVIKKP